MQESNINTLLEDNTTIKNLLKQIIDKIHSQKKYKSESIQMLEMLKNNLKEILEKNKQNDTNNAINIEQNQ